MLKFIQTNHAPKAIGPYAQGVVNQGLLYTSGQIGLDPQTGELIQTSFADQTRQALENMLAIVLAAGSSLDKIISVEVFLTDMAHFAELNKIYSQLFGTHTPARAVLGVASLPKGAALEVKCLATL